MSKKIVYIIAGPNGSGKTTFARELIKETHLKFLNADEIALALSPSNVQKVRLTAGKLFFEKIEKSIKQSVSFIVETTLSGRYFVDIIKKLKKQHYQVKIIYIFLETASEAVLRIENRIKKGGHAVPENDIRRRFGRSKNNFWNVYRKLVDKWEIFLNSKDEFLPVALGTKKEIELLNEKNFELFMRGANQNEKR